MQGVANWDTKSAEHGHKEARDSLKKIEEKEKTYSVSE
jgi:hypothetical protein